ncbi:hypothetical protein FNV43_RR20923 [Rhamnella rubrinervis]|uniref:Nucleotide-diphospho-sugar transferase domain-containing protein n=1 Tax=Rhamnella rubrinervis TaxID=2594499 RepID=A0A8K0DVA5_9ROSA|nr:hypothetical protein FNV43_RR20923 [Rhamnella rubrinervis]
MISKTVALEVDQKVYNWRWTVKVAAVFVGVAVACLVLSIHFPAVLICFPKAVASGIAVASEVKMGERKMVEEEKQRGFNKSIPLDVVLNRASMKNKTVIITTLNNAWAVPNSIFDLFLESFRIGNNTQKLEPTFLVKRFYDSRLLANDVEEIEFLANLLEKGYSFIFSDTDIMWLRDPFYISIQMQISKLHAITSGEILLIERFPGLHDQDVLNNIKHDPFITEIGLQLRFLNTAYFGGFCEPSRDLNLVCTMHANCCVGLDNKVHDLQILLKDWRRFTSSNQTEEPKVSWSVPQYCRSSRGYVTNDLGDHLLRVLQI